MWDYNFYYKFWYRKMLIYLFWLWGVKNHLCEQICSEVAPTVGLILREFVHASSWTGGVYQVKTSDLWQTCAVKRVFWNNHRSKPHRKQVKDISDNEIHRSQIQTTLGILCFLLSCCEITGMCRNNSFLQAPIEVIRVGSSNRSQSNWMQWNIHYTTCKGPCAGHVRFSSSQ